MTRTVRQPILMSLAAAMLCLPNNTLAAPNKEEQPSRFSSLAWVPGYMNYAISGNLPTRKAAEDKALEACRQQVEQGCVIAATSENGVIVLALADDGGRVAFTGQTIGLAKDTALDQCRRRGLRCAIVDSSGYIPVDETVRPKRPSRPIADLWGTFAYREDAFPGNVKAVWAVSQKKTQEDAVTAALQLCQREEKAACVAKAGIRNGFIAAYSFQYEDGTPLIESDVSEKHLAHAIVARCRQAEGGFCPTHVIFDVREPVEGRHELRQYRMMTSP